PSESAMSTILRNSSFETDTLSLGFPFESQFVIRSVNQLSTVVTGLRTKTKNRIIGEITIEIRLGKVAATDFGITSEKTIIVIVKIAEAIPTLNPYCIASEVTRVGSSIFAILFPIKMVVMNSLGLEIKSKSFSAFLSLLSTFVCSFILLVAVNAVSLPEKKNETNNNNMIITKIMDRLSLPKHFNSLIRLAIHIFIYKCEFK